MCETRILGKVNRHIKEASIKTNIGISKRAKKKIGLFLDKYFADIVKDLGELCEVKNKCLLTTRDVHLALVRQGQCRVIRETEEETLRISREDECRGKYSPKPQLYSV